MASTWQIELEGAHTRVDAPRDNDDDGHFDVVVATPGTLARASRSGVGARAERYAPKSKSEGAPAWAPVGL